jgi:hypothetical protein
MNAFASHDSLSGYSLRTWWFAPLNFMAKCQSKNIEQQLAAGVRYFDIRLNKDGSTWYGAHGPMLYNITIDEVLTKLRAFAEANKAHIYYRILHEDEFNRDASLTQFISIIEGKLANYTSQYMHIHFIGLKSQWSNHKYYMNIPFYGRNDYPTSKSGLNSKVREITSIKPRTDLSVYECYTYKGIPTFWGLPYPKLLSSTVNRYALRYHGNAMIDFV